MGDRCWISLEFRASDKDELHAVLGRETCWGASDLFEDEDEKDGVVIASAGEANWAWADELDVLAATGIPFTGHHTEGSEYGAESFVCCNTGGPVYVGVSHGGDIVAPVDFKGELHPGVKETILEFSTEVDKVEAIFDETRKLARKA